MKKLRAHALNDRDSMALNIISDSFNLLLLCIRQENFIIFILDICMQVGIIQKLIM